jgi:hypothetical protein
VTRISRQGGDTWLRRGIVIAFAAATAIYNTCPPVADNDLWGHVYFGRVILTTNHLPATNQFSYTSPDHPWINHEILAECLFALAFDYLGSAGLLALKLIVGLATFGLMLRTIARRTGSVVATALSLAVCGSLISPGFLIRPQIFTFLGLALLWDRINSYEDTRDWRSLVLLPLLFVVWTNTHGGVVAGVGIFLAYVVAGWLSAIRRPERPALALLALLSALALLVNPYGEELVAFLFRDLGRARAISEWQPIPPLALSSIVYEATLAVLAIGIVAGERTRIWEAATLATAAVMTFRQQRHLPLFAILAAPLLAESLDNIGRRIQKFARLSSFSGAARALLAAGLCVAAMFEIGRVVGMYRGLRFQILVSPELFPVDAVRFMKRNRLAGSLVVQSDWGEYAIWHLYPASRVSFDGRYTTAYPDDVLDLSQRFQTGSSGWKAVLDGADLALIDRQQRAVVTGMFEEPAWQYVYSDPTALVFVRKPVADSRTFVRESRTEADNAFFFP